MVLHILKTYFHIISVVHARACEGKMIDEIPFDRVRACASVNTRQVRGCIVRTETQFPDFEPSKFMVS